MKQRLTVVVTVVAMVIFGLIGAAVADTFRVRATSENRWKPKHRYITKGDRIMWRNPTSRSHNIRAYGGNWSYSRSLPPGERRAKRFRKRGTFRYRCTLHSTLSSGRCDGMCGVVHVFTG